MRVPELSQSLAEQEKQGWLSPAAIEKILGFHKFNVGNFDYL